MSDFNYEIERTDHYSLVNAILYGESIQDGTPTPSEPVDVQVVSGRNLLSSTASTTTINGITFTVNADGSVTAIGTATDNIIYDFHSFVSEGFLGIDAGTYTLSGCPSGGSSSTWKLDIESARSIGFLIDYGRGATKTIASGTRIKRCRIVIYNGTTINATFKPQLEAGTAATPYVPYGSIGIVIGDTATPIDLQGNVLASLPDGTKDVLTVDSTGHCVVTKAVSHIASYNGESVGSVYMSTTGQLTTGAEVYYKASSASTTDLGYIDLSYLQDIPAEIPISFVTSLTPDSSYLYKNTTTYEIKNPYEDYNAPEYAYPPNHFGQEWETFDANDWNVSEMLDYTGQPESHAVYTVELCELMQSGAFNWSRPELDWSEAAYDEEQYERFCKYFEERFMFREIGMLPPLQWFTALKRMLVYELMPKYKPLYVQVANGISPLGENEYYKERHVSSSYPETLLSGNSDYISSGEDREFERIKVDNAAEALEAYRNGFRSVDAALGDELEILFISMYTSFVNAF